ncbi:hypothetical protein NTGHW29_70008 [Candidatus Nitrotoga sp. HW29]|nr:hypothetical protein NTGHW29_70008 [Candidatus Nitrotoga sp. HW29]
MKMPVTIVVIIKPLNLFLLVVNAYSKSKRHHALSAYE